MKKAIKYIFIVLISFVILFMMLGKEDNKVDVWADKAMTEITSYYNNNGYYPKNLQDLPLYSNQEFVSQIQNNTFKYSSYGGDKPKYVFFWRGGAMGWSGHRCTNDESMLNEKQEGLIRIERRADGVVCAITDLH